MTKLLLIDDSQYFLHGLAVSLRRAGYEVAVASNGEDGIKLARESRPELILCDVKMPAPNGMAVKRALNEDKGTASIPFIFLSALSTPTNTCQGLHAGADDYIAKPFDLDVLITRIQTALRRETQMEIRSKMEVQHLLENLESSLPIHTSHQFRTQFSILLLSLDMIRRKTDNTEKYLEYAVTSATRAKIMMDTLIWINEFDLGRFPTFGQQIDLETNFFLPVKQLFQIWEEKGLTLDLQVDDGIVVIAPKHSFLMAVCHLIDNACKFSPQNGVIQVHLESNIFGGCILTIQDQGPGIPTSMREMVFERFYQISNEMELPENQGMGLGLYLVRSFARSRGGDVRFLDTFTGCCVEMTLRHK